MEWEGRSNGGRVGGVEAEGAESEGGGGGGIRWGGVGRADEGEFGEKKISTLFSYSVKMLLFSCHFVSFRSVS